MAKSHHIGDASFCSHFANFYQERTLAFAQRWLRLWGGPAVFPSWLLGDARADSRRVLELPCVPGSGAQAGGGGFDVFLALICGDFVGSFSVCGPEGCHSGSLALSVRSGLGVLVPQGPGASPLAASRDSAATGISS